MGFKRKLSALALVFGALTVATACEPSPPPPTEPPKTPVELISNAEYDAIAEGMYIEDVNWLLQKQIPLAQETTVSTPTGTAIQRIYLFEGTFGKCYQEVIVVMENVNEDFEVVSDQPFVVDKLRQQTDCEGIVK